MLRYSYKKIRTHLPHSNFLKHKNKMEVKKKKQMTLQVETMMKKKVIMMMREFVKPNVMLKVMETGVLITVMQKA